MLFIAINFIERKIIDSTQFAIIFVLLHAIYPYMIISL